MGWGLDPKGREPWYHNPSHSNRFGSSVWMHSAVVGPFHFDSRFGPDLGLGPPVPPWNLESFVPSHTVVVPSLLFTAAYVSVLPHRLVGQLISHFTFVALFAPLLFSSCCLVWCSAIHPRGPPPFSLSFLFLAFGSPGFASSYPILNLPPACKCQ